MPKKRCDRSWSDFRAIFLKITFPFSGLLNRWIAVVINTSPLNVTVVIPAYNEEDAIGLVLKDIPAECVNEVVVCNNNSQDQTKEVALSHGVTVLDQPLPGYGNACLKGIEYLRQKPTDQQPDVVVFLDGDYSDHPQEIPSLLRPIVEDDVAMVVGSRVLGDSEKGAMMPQQMFGNWLATALIRIFYNHRFTDLGPFRAIRWQTLLDLEMKDKTFGWTVEMQVKVVKRKLKCVEVPVSYRKRVGVSKISGTIKGTILAGYKIIGTIFKLRFFK